MLLAKYKSFGDTGFYWVQLINNVLLLDITCMTWVTVIEKLHK
jgi:hypothetical protein